MRPFGLNIRNPVFVVSSITVILSVLFALAFQEGATEMFGALRRWLTPTFHNHQNELLHSLLRGNARSH